MPAAKTRMKTYEVYLQTKKYLRLEVTTTNSRDAEALAVKQAAKSWGVDEVKVSVAFRAQETGKRRRIY